MGYVTLENQTYYVVAPQKKAADYTNATITKLQSEMGLSGAAINAAFGGNQGIMIQELVDKGIPLVEAQGFASQFDRARLMPNENANEKIAALDSLGATASSYKDKISKYKTPEQQAAEAQTTQDAAKAEQNTLLQQNTARKMALLNQALQGQRSQGQAAIKAQLAQRNMLSSGSLQGTMAKNDRYFGELAARGGMEAGIQETGGLMDWLNTERARKWQETQQDKQNQYGLQGMQLQNIYGQQNANTQRGWQLQDQSWEEEQAKKNREMQLWGSLLGAGGSIAGGYLGGR